MKDKRIDSYLLTIKSVPIEIVQSEKVHEKLLNKKLSRKQKTSLKIKAALKNYKKSVTRFNLANTLLTKHFKTLSKLVKKYEL